MIDTLDKLRSKEFIFGCRVESNNGNEGTIIKRSSPGYYVVSFDKGEAFLVRLVGYKNIGHPLTRGRLCYLSKIHAEAVQFRNPGVWKKMVDIFWESGVIFDQTELDRMNHEKRPELLKLLEEFALLIPETENDSL